MEDSNFLRDLAHTAREEAEEQRWERWERLTDGTLSSEEEAELRQEDPIAFEAFRPLGSDFKARMTEMIGQLVPPKPEPFWERWLRAVREAPTWPRLRFVGPPIAAAAVMVLALIGIPRPEPQPLPGVKLTQFEPDIARARGADDPVLSPGGAYRAVVQADAKVEMVPACYVAVRSPSRPRLRTVACRISKRLGYGTEITGTLPTDLPVGPATVWTVLGLAKKDLPTADRIAGLPPGKPFREGLWTALPQPIEVRAL